MNADKAHSMKAWRFEHCGIEVTVANSRRLR
jgi:hypothetical protein